MRIQSTPITFIDQTDSRKLEVYIKSNLPTVQIRNSNSGAFTPDWTTGSNLILTASAFLDSRIMAFAEYKDSIVWYKNGSVIASGVNELKITSNELKDSPIITYTCEATYQQLVASAQITFARVDTGVDGKDGSDGTGVTILGSYDSVDTLLAAHPTGNAGDAYIVGGDLYVWAIEDARWENVGNIQGPKGEDAKSIVLVGDSQVIKFNAENTVPTPQTITITPHVVNISSEEMQDMTWEYRYNSYVDWIAIQNGGVVLDGSTTLKNNVLTINGSKLLNSTITSMSFRASVGYAEDVFTVYKVFDGKDGLDGDDASIAFLTNENISFVADENGLVPAQSVVTSVAAYVGSTKVVPQLGALNATLPSGMSIAVDAAETAKLDKEVALKISVTQGVNLGSNLSTNGSVSIPVTSPVGVSLKLSWSKINSGHSGVGIESTEVRYGKSTSAATIPTDWKITIAEVSVAENEYLWTRTIVKYTDTSRQNTTTYTYAKQGASGKDGNSITVSKTEYNKSSSGTVAPTTGWSTNVVSANGGEYLWTRTTFSDKSFSYSVAKQGGDGSNFRTFTTAYEASQTNIENWAKMESTEWDVNESTAGTKVGDTVMIRCYNTTKQGHSYIFATVLSVPSDKKIHSKSTGLLDKGDPGTAASLVDVTPSALYFKSTTGSTGTFEPQYIYLYPRFQNSTYSNWQYSRDGGTTWAAASGANGLTIGTYNSVAYSLRIDRTSTLYTDSITSISFKCNSTTTGVYDTVSIAKIYDVADLQIGCTNLIPQSKMDKLPIAWAGGNGFAMVTEDGYPCARLDGVIGATIAPNINITDKINLTDISQEYTVSAWVKVVNYVGGKTNPFFALYFSGSKASDNTWLGATNIKDSGDLGRFNNAGWSRMTWTLKFDSPMSRMLFYVYLRDMTGSLFIRDIQVEKGNTPSDWSPAPEDLIEEASNINVMLSNEAHFFEATAGGVPVDTSVVLDVVGYKGSVKSATTVGTIAGIPSAGMTTTVSNNGTTNTKITISVTSALTSAIADYGILTIPVTVNGHTINKIFNWTKAKAGNVGQPGDDAVTFQIYSNNGYALSTSVPTITLQTFAYIGDAEIKSDATFQWYRHNNTDWVAVTGATNAYFSVSRDDVSFSNNYMCKMQFNGTEYVGVVTIEDKNDEHKVFATKPSNYFAGDLWVVGTDYIPSGFVVGTMLRAEHTNTTYKDSDWVLATRYDEEIDRLKETVGTYEQYFSANSATGLRVGDASINNNVLSVNKIETTTINAKDIRVESPLTVSGRYSGSTMLQAPILNLGNFSLVIESNGSLSIVANT